MFFFPLQLPDKYLFYLNFNPICYFSASHQKPVSQAVVLTIDTSVVFCKGLCLVCIGCWHQDFLELGKHRINVSVLLVCCLHIHFFPSIIQHYLSACYMPSTRDTNKIKMVVLTTIGNIDNMLIGYNDIAA